MRKRGRRTMSVGDLVILVGTAAIGMGCLVAVDRALLGESLTGATIERWLAVGWNPATWVIVLKEMIAFALPLLAGWSAVLPLLRLRDARPRPRRAFRQPGIVACLAALAGMAWGALAMVVSFGLRQIGPAASRPMAAFGNLAREFGAGQMVKMAGLAVAAAWLGLAVVGRRRRAEDWIDRLGRILGWGWIGAGFVWALGAYYYLM